MRRTTLFAKTLLMVALGSTCMIDGNCEVGGQFDSQLPELTGPDTRDWQGLRRDTRYFLAYQWVTIGMLYASPESVSGWSDEQKEEYDLSVWWDNVSHPEVDSDDFYINYLLHPYWGAAYYVRARQRGYDDRAAFWYSAFLSTLYEFGAEALFEEPSVQDLIVTPVLGSVLGRYFTRVRSDILEREEERGYRGTKDRWIWALTDPLGVLNQRLDEWLGRDAALRMRPYGYAGRALQPASPGSANAEREIVFGVAVQLQW